MRQPVGGWANAYRDSELGFGKEALEPDHPLHHLRRHASCRKNRRRSWRSGARHRRPYLANPEFNTRLHHTLDRLGDEAVGAHPDRERLPKGVTWSRVTSSQGTVSSASRSPIARAFSPQTSSTPTVMSTN